MFGVTPLTPAYGRDYKSKAAAQADFDAGRETGRTEFRGRDPVEHPSEIGVELRVVEEQAAQLDLVL